MWFLEVDEPKDILVFPERLLKEILPDGQNFPQREIKRWVGYIESVNKSMTWQVCVNYTVACGGKIYHEPSMFFMEESPSPEGHVYTHYKGNPFKTRGMARPVDPMGCVKAIIKIESQRGVNAKISKKRKNCLWQPPFFILGKEVENWTHAHFLVLCELWRCWLKDLVGDERANKEVALLDSCCNSFMKGTGPAILALVDKRSIMLMDEKLQAQVQFLRHVCLDEFGDQRSSEISDSQLIQLIQDTE